MQLRHQRPAKKVPGSANALHEKWKDLYPRRYPPWVYDELKNTCGIIRDSDSRSGCGQSTAPVRGSGEILVKATSTTPIGSLNPKGPELLMPDLLTFYKLKFTTVLKAGHLGR